MCRFYESHWKEVSSLAVDLVQKLILVQPKERLSWDKALEHPWIQGNAPNTDLGGEYMVELGQFNARRGMYKLASHALAGLVSRFAQPDAIAAISADTSTLSRILHEGSIQPLISLAYSKSPDDRKNACNAMANLALQEDYQAKLVYEGAVRRMNQLVCKEAQSNDIKFFVALALARLSKNPDLRVPLLDTSVNSDPRVRFAHSCPQTQVSHSCPQAQVSRTCSDSHVSSYRWLTTHERNLDPNPKPSNVQTQTRHQAGTRLGRCRSLYAGQQDAESPIMSITGR